MVCKSVNEIKDHAKNFPNDPRKCPAQGHILVFLSEKEGTRFLYFL